MKRSHLKRLAVNQLETDTHEQEELLSKRQQKLNESLQSHDDRH
jgi:hypothetical protein